MSFTYRGMIMNILMFLSLKIKAQLSSIWAKGCILMTVCVFYLT